MFIRTAVKNPTKFTYDLYLFDFSFKSYRQKTVFSLHTIITQCMSVRHHFNTQKYCSTNCPIIMSLTYRIFYKILILEKSKVYGYSTTLEMCRRERARMQREITKTLITSLLSLLFHSFFFLCSCIDVLYNLIYVLLLTSFYFAVIISTYPPNLITSKFWHYWRWIFLLLNFFYNYLWTYY